MAKKLCQKSSDTSVVRTKRGHKSKTCTVGQFQSIKITLSGQGVHPIRTNMYKLHAFTKFSDSPNEARFFFGTKLNFMRKYVKNHIGPS